MTKPQPAGLETVLGGLLTDMDLLAPAITSAIRTHVPEYTQVPWADHLRGVERQQRRIIQALIEGRDLDEEDLREAAALGRLRASQGVSVEGVISAYHIGNRELWRLIDERAVEERAMLPELASRMWDAIHVTATEIAGAHSSVARARHTHDLTLRHRLIELLTRPIVDDEANEIALRLGFDVNGTFIAAKMSVRDQPERVLQGVRDSFDRIGVVSVAIQRGDTLLVLAQGIEEDALAELISAIDPEIRAGVGSPRPTLTGGHESIHDAEQILLATASHRPLVTYTQDWWLGCALADADRLEAVVAPVVDMARSSPHLIATIRAFADAGFSITGAAKRLHVHPNSVAYRLDRWAQLTGWNPRTLDGLARSMIAAQLVENAEASVTSPNK